MKRNWKIITHSLGCFLMAAFFVKYNLHHGLCNIHDPEETLRYWGLPLAFMHSGFIGWHVRHHKAGPANTDNKDTK